MYINYEYIIYREDLCTILCKRFDPVYLIYDGNTWKRDGYMRIKTNVCEFRWMKLDQRVKAGYKSNIRIK